MKLPTRLLIANRGEIACRILRTAKRLGIETVAVYSDADARALHVQGADQARRIGSAPASASYLDFETILAAALETGADAVHPGYGFLAENADFADACAQRGLIFVGPTPAAIRAMGSKSAAKYLMQRAGVPVTPGYHDADQDPQRLLREAQKLGFPVLVKASAGGGGRGMRRVDRAEDFLAALASCQREALANFKDAQILIERYIENPRHVEVQIFADHHGRTITLGDRDCSVQRRHQKVIEEAPAPGLTASTRAAMAAAAIRAAEAVEYRGAGTVEFILAADGSFYFMEMNTRLQVEHPVTEMITGIDLVEWQLRVAAGEPLPLDPSAIRCDGHAIEVRIYAEDPAREFLPSVGKLIAFALPEPSATVRIDTGFVEGDTITPYYDALLAKLIVHAADREQARKGLRQALESLCVIGVHTNISFLQAILETRSFAEADLDTRLIERESTAVHAAMDKLPTDFWKIATFAWLTTLNEFAPRGQVQHSPWRSADGWRQTGYAVRPLTLRCGSHRAELKIESALIEHSLQGLHVVRESDDRISICLAGRQWRIERELPQRTLADAASHLRKLRAPMPGRITAIHVATGQPIARGAALLTLEAMKMEHTLVAPTDGAVARFPAELGQQVSEGAVLVEFDQQTGE